MFRTDYIPSNDTLASATPIPYFIDFSEVPIQANTFAYDSVSSSANTSSEASSTSNENINNNNNIIQAMTSPMEQWPTVHRINH